MKVRALTSFGNADTACVCEQDDIIYAVDYNHRSEHVLQKTILDSFT
jgi:hypothetical protein